MAMTSLTGASPEDFASVLRSLGYRMERRPKPPPSPGEVQAAVPIEASAPAPADPNGGLEPTCEVDIALPPVDGVATSAGIPVEPGASPEAVKAAAVDEDVIEVWRPGRPEERRHRRPPARSPRREGEPRSPAQAAAPIAAGPPPTEPARASEPAAATEVVAKRRSDRVAPRGPSGPKGRGDVKDRREKAPDPNSPFAKLAVLKAQLEARSKERH